MFVLSVLLFWLSAAAAGETPQELALRAALLDFRQDGRVLPAASVAALYDASCQGGYTTMCAWKSWSRDGRGDLSIAGPAMRPAADADDPLAAVIVGWSLSQIHPGIFDRDASAPAEAATLFQRACDAGLPRACAELGYLFRDGVGVTRNDEKAAALLDRACGSGVANACANLAGMIENGRGAPLDVARARALRQKACEGGDAVGCDRLGRYHRDGGQLGLSATPAERDRARAEAERIWAADCQAGGVDSCNDLGAMLIDQHQRPPRGDEAATLLQRACDLSGGAKCSRLAGVMLDGLAGARAVEQPATTAPRLFFVRRWYSGSQREFTPEAAPAVTNLLLRSCAAGEQDGCYGASAMLASGVGVAADPARARALARDVCADDRSRCTMLGEFERLGIGAPADPERARALFERACQDDDAFGCLRFANALEHGWGGPAQVPAAGTWYERACKLGSELACLELEDQYAGERTPAAQDPAFRAALDDLATSPVAEAVGRREQACGAGSRADCVILAAALSGSSGVWPDFGRASTLSEELCATGEGLGCLIGGTLLQLELDREQDELRRMKLIVKGCELGEPQSCVLQAQGARLGAPGAGNRDLVVPLLEQTCARGFAPACNAAGLHRHTEHLSNVYPGTYLATTSASAQEVFEQACDGGYLPACGNLGMLVTAASTGPVKLPSRALLRFEQACDGGIAWGCYYLGLLHDTGEGRVAMDSAAAQRDWQRGCQLKDERSCNKLATLWANGVRPALVREIEELRATCDSGDDYACVELGVRETYGLGVSYAPDEGRAHLATACANGHSLGCTFEGLTMLESGTPTGSPLLVDRLRRACNEGVLTACTGYGRMQRDGLGMNADPFSGSARLAKSCDEGHGQACLWLADSYERGIGVVPSKKLARLYRETACSTGLEGACGKR